MPGDNETPAPQATVRAKYRIVGEVQRVGMRAWIADEARQRGLGGWVRNERDGSVTALFIGGQEAVLVVTQWLEQGTPSSQVLDICPLALDDPDSGWDATADFTVLN